MGAAKAPAQTEASAALHQLGQAFSGSQPVHDVVLQGTATWTAGSLEDSGPVTLTASSSGASQMQISLSVQGSRTESQTGLGSAQSCTWTDAKGISHEVLSANCWRPVLPLLPAISLQPGLTASSVGVSDMGAGSLHSATYRHLQSQFVFSDTPMRITKDVMQSSTTDLWLDAASLLPAAMTYKVLPDSGASTAIAIEMQYSNYTAVNGVRIPFRIQRYVNGSLQLDITVSSAQIN